MTRFPAEANGYLILNQYDNPDVFRWEISFLKPEFSPNGPIISFETERIVEIEGGYFTDQVEISDNSDHHGFINIPGYDALDNVIVTDGPITYGCVGCEVQNYCVPGCNGKTYAYGVDVIGPPTTSTSAPG